MIYGTAGTAMVMMLHVRINIYYQAIKKAADKQSPFFCRIVSSTTPAILF
jgi:hypothetical protein